MPLAERSVSESLERNGAHYFGDASLVYSAPGGWLNGTRTDILYGAGVVGENVRALVYQGVSGGILPFRLFVRPNESGSLSSRMVAETVDVGVFPEHSSQRIFDARVYSRFGLLPLPFFERRVARAFRKAEQRAGEMALSAQLAEV